MANPVTLPEINETPQLVGASSRTTKQRRANRAAVVDALNQVYRATAQDALRFRFTSALLLLCGTHAQPSNGLGGTSNPAASVRGGAIVGHLSGGKCGKTLS